MLKSRPSPIKWSLMSLCLYRDPFQGNGHRFLVYQDPLRWNGLWFPFVYINDPLRWNGHWSPYVYIETLYEAMVIDFRYIKNLFNGMVFDFLLFISTTLSNGMVIDLLMFLSTTLSDGMVFNFLLFISRPSPMDGHWFSYVHIEALCEAMVINFLSYQGPLRWNGLWPLCVSIKVLFHGMIIDLFMFIWRTSPIE